MLRRQYDRKRYRIQNSKRGETLQNRRSDQRAKQNPEISGHNHIAVDSEIKFLKGYTDGKCFLSEYDFIEIPDSEREKYKPITFLGNLKNVN